MKNRDENSLKYFVKRLRQSAEEMARCKKAIWECEDDGGKYGLIYGTLLREKARLTEEHNMVLMAVNALAGEEAEYAVITFYDNVEILFRSSEEYGTKHAKFQEYRANLLDSLTE